MNNNIHDIQKEALKAFKDIKAHEQADIFKSTPGSTTFEDIHNLTKSVGPLTQKMFEDKIEALQADINSIKSDLKEIKDFILKSPVAGSKPASETRVGGG